MGQVDLDFQPTVPVFDANVSLGRRHNQRVSVDSPEDTLSEMARAGVQRAVVYSPHAVNFDSRDGNNLLLETIESHVGFVPQFVGNPTFDNLDEFSSEIAELNIRSVRLAPIPPRYPFQDWILGEWLEWMESEDLPIWIDATHVNPIELHAVIKSHPKAKFLLAEVHYTHLPWAMPLLKSLTNTYIELSRIVSVDGINRLLNLVGSDRILFGSRFPESSMAPQIYSLHLNDLSNEDLTAICAGNLERLLGLT